MATPALVSVLIRTLGRATLARSIAAAAAQTHRPIEIVVVNAGTLALEPPRPAGVELRVIGGWPYDRPRAANAALTHARGEWLVFLDDDDAFAPTHVEWLLDAVGKAPGARTPAPGAVPRKQGASSAACCRIVQWDQALPPISPQAGSVDSIA